MKFTTKFQQIHQTLTNTNDQGEETNSTILGTILVIIAGVVLYTDKIIDYFNIDFNYQFEYYNNIEVFVWCLSATISPLLLIVGYWVKPYRWALASPLSAYAVQLMYIWRDEKWIQKDYFWYHTIAFIAIFYLIILLHQEYQKRRSTAFYIELIRELFMFIGPETEKEGYIDINKKADYARRRIQLTDKAVGNE